MRDFSQILFKSPCNMTISVKTQSPLPFPKYLTAFFYNRYIFIKVACMFALQGQPLGLCERSLWRDWVMEDAMQPLLHPQWWGELWIPAPKPTAAPAELTASCLAAVYSLPPLPLEDVLGSFIFSADKYMQIPIRKRYEYTNSIWLPERGEPHVKCCVGELPFCC